MGGCLGRASRQNTLVTRWLGSADTTRRGRGQQRACFVLCVCPRKRERERGRQAGKALIADACAKVAGPSPARRCAIGGGDKWDSASKGLGGTKTGGKQGGG